VLENQDEDPNSLTPLQERTSEGHIEANVTENVYCAFLGCLLVWRHASEGLVEAKARASQCYQYGETVVVVGLDMGPDRF
jgi:hypothetical protein